MTDDFGFIIIRNVSNEINNTYWKECYKCIRKFYSNKIIIIDTGSIKEFLDSIDLINCEIIYNDIDKKAMISAYYHFYMKKFFNKAVILQDSVFIQKYVEFNNINDIKFIWEFTHDWDVPNDEIRLIKYLNDSEKLIDFYNSKDLWKGCFGPMSVISYDFLKTMQDKYNILKLYEVINNWYDWMALERVFAMLCTYENRLLLNDSSILGDVMKSQYRWGYNIDEYNSNNYDKSLPIAKIFTTRK